MGLLHKTAGKQINLPGPVLAQAHEGILRQRDFRGYSTFG
jgi:hypothetical protein